MEVPLGRRNLNWLAGPASIGIARGVERLMNITDQVDQKCEVVIGTSLVMAGIAGPPRALIDFLRCRGFR